MISGEERAAAAELTRPLARALAEPYRVPDERLIREPGQYQVSMKNYVADPVAGGSLSSTGARLIMKPGGPARLRYKLDHPDEPKDAFDFGKAAHQVVLGDSENHIAVIPFDEWRSNAAKAAVAEARAAGLTPVKPEQWAKVHAMAAAINSNRTAAGLIHSASGRPEQTLVWVDELTGVWCRARVDWARTKKAGPRHLIVDYKTTSKDEGAAPDVFGRAAADFGYFVQGEWYRTGVRTLGIDEEPAFLLIVQETDPPYLVNVVELDDVALTLGRNFMRGALNTFAECRRTGHWPGFSKVQLVQLPPWFVRQYDEEPDPIPSPVRSA